MIHDFLLIVRLVVNLPLELQQCFFSLCHFFICFQNGVLSAMPYIAGLIFTLLLAPVDSVMIRRRWLSIPRARKLWSSISKCFSLSLILLAFVYRILVPSFKNLREYLNMPLGCGRVLDCPEGFRRFFVNNKG